MRSCRQCEEQRGQPEAGDNKDVLQIDAQLHATRTAERRHGLWVVALNESGDIFILAVFRVALERGRLSVEEVLVLASYFGWLELPSRKGALTARDCLCFHTTSRTHALVPPLPACIPTRRHWYTTNTLQPSHTRPPPRPVLASPRRARVPALRD
jgi:hypothetical protein